LRGHSSPVIVEQLVEEMLKHLRNLATELREASLHVFQVLVRTHQLTSLYVGSLERKRFHRLLQLRHQFCRLDMTTILVEDDRALKMAPISADVETVHA
jgi:hypothetical protein